MGKSVLVMHETTEHPEVLDAETVKIVGTDYDKIVSILLKDVSTYEQMCKAVNPSGHGNSNPPI